MMNNRAVLVTLLMVAGITILVMGFSDKLSKAKPCDIHRIDNCAKTGGFDR